MKNIWVTVWGQCEGCVVDGGFDGCLVGLLLGGSVGVRVG